MKTLLLLLLLAALVAAGCASGPDKLVTTELFMQHGTNLVRFTQPKDTSFKRLEWRPDGGILVEEYLSAANREAIEASRAQAAIFSQAFQLGADAAAGYLRINGVPASVTVSTNRLNP